MRIPIRFHPLRISIALAAALALILGVVIILRTIQVEKTAASVQQPADSQYRPVPMEGSQRPSALFAGDDFAAGYGEIARNAYPYIVCHAIGLNCNVDAQTGTGFVNDGQDHLTGTVRMIDRLQTDRRIFDVDLVIVDAGRNDGEAPSDAYGSAVAKYLGEVSRLWPAARIVVIAPYYLSSDPSPDYAARIAVISQVVQSVGGLLTDPVAQGWFVGVDTSALVLPDGVHPNQRGQEFIAKKLGESLRSQGFGQSGATN